MEKHLCSQNWILLPRGVRTTDGDGRHCQGGLFLLCLRERARHVTVWLWSGSGLGVSRFFLAVIFKDEIKVHKAYKVTRILIQSIV